MILRNTRYLNVLDLSSNEVTNKGVAALAENLQFNSSLSFLNLSTLDGVMRNRIGVLGGQAISQVLSRPGHVMQSLIFNNTSLGDKGLKAILDPCVALINEELKKMESETKADMRILRQASAAQSDVEDLKDHEALFHDTETDGVDLQDLLEKEV